MKTPKPCSVDTCNEDARCLGMCKSHYGKARYQANKEHHLAVVKAYQAANLDKYRETQRKYKAANKERVDATSKRSYDKRVNNPWAFKGEPVSTAEVTYIGAHARVKVNRGLASLYECPCGKPAEQWAHNHSENSYTRLGLITNFQGERVLAPYSLDVWDYLALCRSCHTKFDKTGLMLHDYERLSA